MCRGFVTGDRKRKRDVGRHGNDDDAILLNAGPAKRLALAGARDAELLSFTPEPYPEPLRLTPDPFLESIRMTQEPLPLTPEPLLEPVRLTQEPIRLTQDPPRLTPEPRLAPTVTSMSVRPYARSVSRSVSRPASQSAARGASNARAASVDRATARAQILVEKLQGIVAETRQFCYRLAACSGRRGAGSNGAIDSATPDDASALLAGLTNLIDVFPRRIPNAPTELAACCSQLAQYVRLQCMQFVGLSCATVDIEREYNVHTALEDYPVVDAALAYVRVLLQLRRHPIFGEEVARRMPNEKFRAALYSFAEVCRALQGTADEAEELILLVETEAWGTTVNDPIVVD